MNSRGFASLTMLGFMPIVLSLVTGFSFLKTVLQVRLLPLQICRTESLDYQKESAELVEELFRTHPIVLALRLEMTQAQLLLAAGIASENPAVIARALQWIRTVRTRQAQLLKYQKSILIRHQARRAQFRIKSKMHFSQKWNELKNRLSPFWVLQSYGWQAEARDLPLRPDIHSDKPAIYGLEDDFSLKQTSSIFWITELQVNSTSWLRNWIEPNVKVKEDCRASLWPDKGKLTEALWKKDKFFSRLF